jgi:hypothetical protein
MRNIPLSTSILLNSMIPGSRRYEMLSSRAYRLSHTRRWECLRILIDVYFAIFFKEPAHCKACHDVQLAELGHLWNKQ